MQDRYCKMGFICFWPTSYQAFVCHRKNILFCQNWKREMIRELQFYIFLAFTLFLYAIEFSIQNQARSELRFWRGAEVDKVQNPKQLYVRILGKVGKIVIFGSCGGAPQAKITSFTKFLTF